jgi:hypothetical protein
MWSFIAHSSGATELARFFTRLCGVHVVDVNLHVFRFLVSCCHVCYYVRVKNDVWFVLPPISFVGGSSFICIYLEYLGPTSSSFVLTSTVWSTTYISVFGSNCFAWAGIRFGCIKLCRSYIEYIYSYVSRQ